MSRWLIAMAGTMQDKVDDNVKTEVQILDNLQKHPTEGKGAQLNHPGFEGDGNDVKDNNKTNVVPLKDGQENTPEITKPWQFYHIIRNFDYLLGVIYEFIW